MTRRLWGLYPRDRTLLLGALGVLGVGWIMALAWVPPDRVQGDVQRLS